MKMITAKQLHAARACSMHLQLFVSEYGDAAEVTEESCLEAATMFPFGWAFMILLPKEFKDRYWPQVQEEVWPAQVTCEEETARAVAFADVDRAQSKLTFARQRALARYFARAWAELPEDYTP